MVEVDACHKVLGDISGRKCTVSDQFEPFVNSSLHLPKHPKAQQEQFNSKVNFKYSIIHYYCATYDEYG